MKYYCALWLLSCVPLSSPLSTGPAATSRTRSDRRAQKTPTTTSGAVRSAGKTKRRTRSDDMDEVTAQRVSNLDLISILLYAALCVCENSTSVAYVRSTCAYVLVGLMLLNWSCWPTAPHPPTRETHSSIQTFARFL